MSNVRARRWGIRFLLTLSISLIVLPSSGLAASEANLAILYKGFVAGSTQDLKFTVYNDGLGRTPATQVTFQLVKPTTGAKVTKPIQALDQNGSSDVVYHLDAPCTPGTVVRASVALKDAAYPKEGTVDANACSPDLQLVIVGFAPGSLGDVQLAIHNIGPVSSPPAVATAGTVKPGAYNEETFNVPSLAPDAYFPFLYTLGGSKPTDCDGHQIKAEVKLSGDADLANNTAEATLCAPKPPPPTPTPVPTPVVPSYKQAGVHQNVRFPAQNTESAQVEHHRGYCFLSDTDAALMGWEQCSGLIDYAYQVLQLAARFDLRQMDDIPLKALASAKLKFDERRLAWRDADGNQAQGVYGCVTTLGIATTDWLKVPPAGLFPNDTYVSLDDQNFREIDVTGPVQDMLNYPGDPTLRYGFVLRGRYENLSADADSACLSRISNIRLELTYVVPDQQ
jgi:hypothetical protein